MGKQEWKPGNMLYPLPAVMVSCADKKGNSNILTVGSGMQQSCTLRQTEHSYRRMGRHRMYQSAHGFHIGAS